jgi:hypothetical protein
MHTLLCETAITAQYFNFVKVQLDFYYVRVCPDRSLWRCSAEHCPSSICCNPHLHVPYGFVNVVITCISR